MTEKARVIEPGGGHRIVEITESSAFDNTYLNHVLEFADGEDSMGETRWVTIQKTHRCEDSDNVQLEGKTFKFLMRTIAGLRKSLELEVKRQKTIEDIL